ncbi:MAG: dephospho-CoA kinase [Myxococcota bacterium]|nr:dephospho-CoA kinase [Myxococcota bacterium]
MHLFGLTGGIASGKSMVAARLRARGVPVIDADELAREVLAPGSAGLREVVQAFGEWLLDSSGGLDRKALARVVFTDEMARRKLDAITHPRIAAETLARAADLAGQSEPLACYEAALIVENGLVEAFRPLVVCACPEPIQVARIRERDGLSTEDAFARIRVQRPLADKLAVADHVIDTSRPLDENTHQTDDVLRSICDRLGVDIARYLPG